jgi:hypothetical protein
MIGHLEFEQYGCNPLLHPLSVRWAQAGCS